MYLTLIASGRPLAGTCTITWFLCQIEGTFPQHKVTLRGAFCLKKVLDLLKTIPQKAKPLKP